MNKNIFLLLALSWMLVGCSGAPIASEGSALADCRKPFPWFCRNGPGNQEVTLNTKNKKLKVSPYCLKVHADTKITFNIKPPGNNPKGTVHIVPKNPDRDGWLAASNDDDDNTDIITVTVPEDAEHDLKYYYGVRTADACVDPRIRVDP